VVRRKKREGSGDERVLNTLAKLSHLPQRQPPFRRKVDTLSAVEAQVEPAVVALRVGQDELAGELADAVEGDTGAGEDTGRGEEGFVAEELVAFAEVGGEVTWRREGSVSFVTPQVEGRTVNAPSITLSNLPRCSCGTAYQNFGAPKWM
jgi:hypothetical protein